MIAVSLLVAGATTSLAAAEPRSGAPATTSTTVVVNEDRSVTFRVESGYAEKVEIGGDFRFGRMAVGREAMGAEATGAVDSVPMTRASDSVWTFTSEPASPMVYRYFFVVDGTRTPTKKVEVGGPGAMPWDLIPDIPHGTLVVEKLHSVALEAVKQLVVYLPPDYRTSDRTYPVLYLLHGGGDGSFEDWVDEGYLDNVMDALVSSGKAKPMIVVMPDRGLLTSAERAELDSLSGKELQVFLEARDQRRADYLLRELVPFIESRYRVAKGSASIAGLSGGAGETFELITSHPDTFVAAGMFSGSVGMGRSADYEPYRTMMRNTLQNARDHVRRLRLLYVSCGDYDPLLGPNRVLHQTLEELAIPHVYVEGEGAHQWPFWTRAVVDFVSRLSSAVISP